MAAAVAAEAVSVPLGASARPGGLLGSSALLRSASLSLSEGGGHRGFSEMHAPLALRFSSCADSFRFLFLSF